ncbi:SRPBCC family protein [Mycolicibacter senuensis]|nr:hypothetical protein [Mycolicibacter senuensis]ORW66832.1 hypothetical protein AWC24_12755 [Mycolicibacter senuensis]
MTDDLPYIDEHTVDVAAPRQLVWSGLRRYVESLLDGAERNPLVALLGPQPRAGFAVAESVEQQRLSLTGRHRFSRYRLVFALSDAPDGGTRVHALSYAAFPGLRGRVYRGLVIGTRLHVVATNYMLHGIRAAARTVPGESR